MEEIWKEVKGFETYVVSDSGKIKNVSTNVILTPGNDKDGYSIVCLYKSKKGSTKRVHKLVYEAFVGIVPDNMEIIHKDENKQNNSLGNLQLVSHKENCNYGTRNQRILQNRTGRFKEKIIYQKDKNGNIVNTFKSVRDAERKTGFSSSNIVNCCNGKTKTSYGYKWEYAVL